MSWGLSWPFTEELLSWPFRSGLLKSGREAIHIGVVKQRCVCSQVETRHARTASKLCLVDISVIHLFVYMSRRRVVMEYQNPLHPKMSYGIADGGGPTVAREEEGHGNGGDERDTLSATYCKAVLNIFVHLF